MIRLYDSAFSPFARKVRLVLDHKGLAYEAVDGLLQAQRDALARVNGRVEVPVIEHGGLLVSNSADIVAYLERVFPENPVYPADAADYVRARAWERCNDTLIDPILTDISYWTWTKRRDSMPPGLLAAARRDLARIYAALEAQLGDGEWVCGALSIADFSLFPTLSAARALEVPFDAEHHPRLVAWHRRCRALPSFAADLARIKHYLASLDEIEVEREKIFWRGDRIEWLLARGFHHWLVREIEEDRVVWPGMAIPQPTPELP